ncbi:hypothetical protein F4777DRAFT_563384 [Nemania sp. FL0916]|nr:hypothetical protein F4777DRAFT_563384 [Nemania sp. FL0916]
MYADHMCLIITSHWHSSPVFRAALWFCLLPRSSSSLAQVYCCWSLRQIILQLLVPCMHELLENCYLSCTYGRFLSAASCCLILSPHITKYSIIKSGQNYATQPAYDHVPRPFSSRWQCTPSSSVDLTSLTLRLNIERIDTLVTCSLAKICSVGSTRRGTAT